MSTPFLIGSFEEYLDTVLKELPKGRIYFRVFEIDGKC